MFCPALSGSDHLKVDLQAARQGAFSLQLTIVASQFTVLIVGKRGGMIRSRTYTCSIKLLIVLMVSISLAAIGAGQQEGEAEPHEDRPAIEIAVQELPLLVERLGAFEITHDAPHRHQDEMRIDAQLAGPASELLRLQLPAIDYILPGDTIIGFLVPGVGLYNGLAPASGYVHGTITLRKEQREGYSDWYTLVETVTIPILMRFDIRGAPTSISVEALEISDFSGRVVRKGETLGTFSIVNTSGTRQAFWARFPTMKEDGSSAFAARRVGAAASEPDIVEPQQTRRFEIYAARGLGIGEYTANLVVWDSFRNEAAVPITIKVSPERVTPWGLTIVLLLLNSAFASAIIWSIWKAKTTKKMWLDGRVQWRSARLWVHTPYVVPLVLSLFQLAANAAPILIYSHARFSVGCLTAPLVWGSLTGFGIVLPLVVVPGITLVAHMLRIGPGQQEKKIASGAPGIQRRHRTRCRSIQAPQRGIRSPRSWRVEKWYVEVGSGVQKNEILGRVYSSRGSENVKAPMNGMISRILVPQDRFAARGEPLIEVCTGPSQVVKRVRRDIAVDESGKPLRVHEIASKLALSAKDVLAHLEKLGIDKRNSLCTLTLFEQNQLLTRLAFVSDETRTELISEKALPPAEMELGNEAINNDLRNASGVRMAFCKAVEANITDSLHSIFPHRGSMFRSLLIPWRPKIRRVRLLVDLASEISDQLYSLTRKAGSEQGLSASARLSGGAIGCKVYEVSAIHAKMHVVAGFLAPGLLIPEGSSYVDTVSAVAVDVLQSAVSQFQERIMTRGPCVTLWSIGTSGKWPAGFTIPSGGNSYAVLSHLTDTQEWESVVPEIPFDRNSLGPFLDRLRPETQSKRYSRIRQAVDRSLDDSSRAYVTIQSISEETGYDRTSVGEAFLALQETAQYQLHRRPKDKEVCISHDVSDRSNVLRSLRPGFVRWHSLRILSGLVGVGGWLACELLLERGGVGYPVLVVIVYLGNLLQTEIDRRVST